MITDTLEKLKYPIGKFTAPADYALDQYIHTIEQFPARLKKEVIPLTDEQLDTPYRPQGWTIRQVVHHCADSHSNALTRFKLAITENNPVIKPYPENLFAELSDSKLLSIHPSLHILEGIHFRWSVLLRAMDNASFEKKFIHPEYKTEFSLFHATAQYAWHCDHHLAHITTLKESKKW